MSDLNAYATSKSVTTKADPSSYEGRKDVVQRQIVILIHGIRDFALWQDTIRSALEEAGFAVEVTNYGRLNLIQFLLPINYFRQRAIEKIWLQIRIIKQNNPDVVISLIAHSFGTYVASKLLKDEFDIILHRVIFAGV